MSLILSPSRRRLLQIAALTSVPAWHSSHADNAAAFPSRGLRCVLGFPPGGAVDANARVICSKLADYWKQPVVIENRGGAGSTIGTAVVAAAAPDGYTFLIASPAHAINATLYKKLPYDTEKAFVPVAQLTSSPLFVYLHPSVPAKSIRELVALAKSQPGKLNYGSSGSGTSTHLAAALFNMTAETDIVHIPFSGGGPVYSALLANTVQLTFGGVEGLSHVRAGKLRAIAVTTSKRFAMAPEWPTVAESGLPGYEVEAWYGVYVPAGTPAAVVDKMNADINRMLALSSVQEQYGKIGLEVKNTTAAQFAAFTRSEIEMWRKVITTANIRIE